MKIARLAFIAAALLVVLPLAAAPPGGDETPFLLDDGRASDDCGFPALTSPGTPVATDPGLVGRIDPIDSSLRPDDVPGQPLSPRSPPR